MERTPIASVSLVVRAALLALVTGCGVSGAHGPQPVASSSTSATPAVAPLGPQLGYLWQAANQNLYPVLGVAGAAHFGSGVLTTGNNVVASAASGSATASWALLLEKNGALDEMQLPSTTTTTLTAHVPLDSTIAFSPSGVAAAVVSPSTLSVLVVTGLPAQPRVGPLKIAAGSTLAGLAVSDAGTVLAGLQRAGTSSVQVVVLSSTQTSTVIAALHAWGGAGFVPAAVTSSGSEAAVLADGSSGQLLSITNPGGTSPTIASLPTAGLLQSPAGVGISPDGHWALIADSGKAQIVRVSLTSSSAAPTAIACACSPIEMVALTATGLFSVSAPAAGQPAWILDGGAASPRTFFVPAVAATVSTPTSSSNSTVAAAGKPLPRTSR